MCDPCYSSFHLRDEFQSQDVPGIIRHHYDGHEMVTLGQISVFCHLDCCCSLVDVLPMDELAHVSGMMTSKCQQLESSPRYQHRTIRSFAMPYQHSHWLLACRVLCLFTDLQMMSSICAYLICLGALLLHDKPVEFVRLLSSRIHYYVIRTF